MATPSLVLIPSAYKVGKVASVKPMDGKGDFTFTRNSEATRVNSIGLIETVGVDVPRIDHSDGGCPSLLLEPASTNLITYSEDFSDSYWTITDSSIVSGSASPNGDMSAFKLIEGTSTGTHLVFNTSNVTVLNSTRYTSFIYAKKGDNNWIALAEGTSTTATAYFDLLNGVVGNVIGTGSPTANIESLSGGWYKCSISYTTVSTSIRLRVYASKDGTTVSYAGDGASYIYIWGAQLEQNSHATSYIPTNGTTVTRAAEVCSGAGDATTFNSEEGVLFVDINPLDTGNFKGIGIGQVTGDSLWIYVTGVNEISAQIRIGGATQFYLIDSKIVSDFTKVAFKWALNDFSLWVNGVEEASSIVGSLLPLGTLQSLQLHVPGASNNFYGKVKQLQVFKTALTDTELQTLTSPSSTSSTSGASSYSADYSSDYGF
tara:strand:- start:24 stop:1313 length:1290 start_codon:yes stop_codon:yes gene_type:complete